MRHSKGLANWSIRHPVGVIMLALAVIVVGAFALNRLSVDLLPHIIYPEIRVRVLDSGVPPSVMEDRVTRKLEEQLAITEDAIHVQSTTTQGTTTVDLAFEYGKDIDVALRDASTRLDRARRSLPESIDAPVIYKLDPSQIPVMEFVISSPIRDSAALRQWADDVMAKWLLNLPGVAAAEVGGGVVREVHIIPDQQRMAAYDISYTTLTDAIAEGNGDQAAGRITMPGNELNSRISGRLISLEQLRQLPVARRGDTSLTLADLARVEFNTEAERILIRADGVQGIKLSIQKQPAANTTYVADQVKARLTWLEQQQIIPIDISVTQVSDQSIYVKQALNNATTAAISGALLAMAVVYLFLGNLRHTLIIGSAIPIAIMFTCVLMGLGGLTLNIMTLGGLALGIGMLVDNTIVMLENISRHQQNHEHPLAAANHAATEVNSAIIASTSTNLCAILPFLFIGGLTGLLFQELIITISAAIFASMVIALTLVPALAAATKPSRAGGIRYLTDRVVQRIQQVYTALLERLLAYRLLTLLSFSIALIVSLPVLTSGKQIFLPPLDDGRITVRITADTGISLSDMNTRVKQLEALFSDQAETETVFTLVGGSVFGRSQREQSNRSTVIVQLKSVAERELSSHQWIDKLQRQIASLQLAGFTIRMTQRGIRGIRTNSGSEDISLRLQGPDNQTLIRLADALTDQLKTLPQLRNLSHSAEDRLNELAISLDRVRANQLGIELEDLIEATQIALQGKIISEFITDDHAYDIRLRLAEQHFNTPQSLETLLLFPATGASSPVHLADVASIQLIESAASIQRDNQMRIVEISASLAPEMTLGEALSAVNALRADVSLPQGYTLYDGGSEKALAEQNKLTLMLLGLALFLVFVVMAIQYESLRNPLIIIFGVPFAAIGVAGGLWLTAIPLSMPVWLGMIMLTGIVVNNAILLVEYVEIARDQGCSVAEAILDAARLRLRPIIMTTLSTVAGMLPLALGWGDGAEMLQPLAITVIWGLCFSMLVSLVLIPVTYHLINHRRSSLS
ncbi:efflux RND transporter permease subunit [Amphritea sp. 1_MG-2023]|uniref:efflux RND transporter permease subunit n=1 Tax=Amphritea sp. 1_MG-2023 TaxID=3062670 RepID=UPI0026E28144|nr:efflux RND transporter permease subunit [Amphritea sp. 1_MG-2023]MDO6564819.1 efflux RND transporter permease subunit [Amphritea sp. 1_MG-2023]